MCQRKAKVINLNLFGTYAHQYSLYQPVNAIWQSISSETMLFEKHFRGLSTDGHGAMNQNIFVVCTGVRNSPF